MKLPETGGGPDTLQDFSHCVVPTALPPGVNSALFSQGSTENVFEGDCISFWQQGNDSLAMLLYV